MGFHGERPLPRVLSLAHRVHIFGEESVLTHDSVRRAQPKNNSMQRPSPYLRATFLDISANPWDLGTTYPKVDVMPQ